MGMQKREIRILAVFLVMVFMFKHLNFTETSLRKEKENEKMTISYSNKIDVPETEKEPTKVPVIYMFYAPKLQQSGVEGDNAIENIQLIHMWKTLWKESGWEPRVLDLEDAKKHPDFIKYSEILQNSVYTNLYDQSYDSLCFLRWLAMASHGSGGWMADYDTIPMGISVMTGLNLPNNGKFTSYEQWVPSLMSGTAEEWERMSHLVLNQVKNEKNDDSKDVPANHYSDMLALKHVHDEDGGNVFFPTPQSVLSEYPYRVNTDDVSNIIDCALLSENNIWVVHLSHAYTERAIESNRLHSPQNAKSWRHAFAWELYFHWKYECKPNFNFILDRAQ